MYGVRGETAHFWGPFMCVYYGEGIFHHNISEERPQRQKRGIFPEKNSAKTDLCCLSLPPFFGVFFLVFYPEFPLNSSPPVSYLLPYSLRHSTVLFREENVLYEDYSTFQPLGSISVPKDSVFFSTLLSGK
jgi:hypothetical protein